MKIEDAGQRRIELLKAKQRRIDAALATEISKATKLERRMTEKLELLLGAAVRKTGATSPEFRTMIAKQALASITGKEREFLTKRGW